MVRALRSLVAILSAVILALEPAGAQVGNSGAAFLKLGVSGRGLAMGDAMSAVVTGAASTYYNPAGILGFSGPEGPQLMFTHKEWIQDTRVEFLGSSMPLDEDNAIGFSMNSTTVSDIEVRTRPGPVEATFTARDY